PLGAAPLSPAISTTETESPGCHLCLAVAASPDDAELSLEPPPRTGSSPVASARNWAACGLSPAIDMGAPIGSSPPDGAPLGPGICSGIIRGGSGLVPSASI